MVLINGIEILVLFGIICCLIVIVAGLTCCLLKNNQTATILNIELGNFEPEQLVEQEPVVENETRPAWAGFKTAEVGIAIIMCNIW